MTRIYTYITLLTLLCLSVNAQRTRVLSRVHQRHGRQAGTKHPELAGGIPTPGYCGRGGAGNGEWKTKAQPLTHNRETGEPVSLVAVQVAIRHGDRIPVSGGNCWPGCSTVWNCTQDENFSSSLTSPTQTGFQVEYIPNRNVYPGNCMYGQLTSKGWSQHVANGEMFRQLYVDTSFLPTTLNTSDIWVRADESRRCRTSALALMEGLYPASNRAASDLNIVLHSMDGQFDDMTPNSNLCPRLAQYKQELQASTMWQQHQTQVTQPLTQRLQQALNTTQSVSIHSFIGCLNCHLCHQFPYPAGIDQELYDALVKEVTWETRMGYSYPNVTAASRVGIGFLLKEIMSNFEQPQYKFRLYSGHDSTLNPLLNALGLWPQLDYTWTPYASTLVFELYTSSISNGQYFRVVYNGQPMTIAGCTQLLCPRAQFIAAIQAVLPDGVQQDCSVQ